jgi:hypothetical protein
LLWTIRFLAVPLILRLHYLFALFEADFELVVRQAAGGGRCVAGGTGRVQRLAGEVERLPKPAESTGQPTEISGVQLEAEW